eukprot:TRINITY_DN1502_c0_g1_i1.p1 TRINITY_DN1502_c0_g1~~TRINITY_DN1502_c0_g1_i1.p1  ORF type:complete len:172 (+),score=16.29 TRINITY_DN1502_c0_g1_i1:102-617(+)
MFIPRNPPTGLSLLRALLVVLSFAAAGASIPSAGHVTIEKYGTLWDKVPECNTETEWCGDTFADGNSCTLMGIPCTTSNCKYGVRAKLEANNMVTAKLCTDAYCSDRCTDWVWPCDSCVCGLNGPYTNDGCSAYYKVTCNAVCAGSSLRPMWVGLQAAFLGVVLYYVAGSV